MKRTIYPVAAVLAATINVMTEHRRDVSRKVTAEEIMEMATDEEIMFFYVRMCL